VPRHLVATAPARADGLLKSPDGQAVVVTANLNEAWTKEDVADTSDMEVFATRLLGQVPYAPDALLIQEVSKTAARNIASILSSMTGMEYTVAVAARKLRAETATHTYSYANAILLNSTTMRKLDSGGFIQTTYKREDTVSGGKPNVSNTAFMLAGERGGALEVPLASLHFAKQSTFKSESIADSYKKAWSEKVATKLKKAYGTSSKRIRTFGGDFNDERCNENDPCNPNAFWKSLTSSTYGYRDTVHTAGGVGGVDFLFARGGVYGADLDSTYSGKLDPGDPGFYSDHRFRWAHVGTDVTAPTAPKDVTATSINQAIAVSWTAATDAQSGIARYEVWKSGASKWDPRLIGTTSLTRLVDSNVYRLKTYRYYVVAIDGSHNETRSNIVKVTANW
jgi:hypothetical protein